MNKTELTAAVAEKAELSKKDADASFLPLFNGLLVNHRDIPLFSSDRNIG